MPKPVSNPPDVTPRQTGAEHFSLIAEPDGSLADHLQLALYGRDCFFIGTEFSGVHVERKPLDCADRFGNVA